MINIKMFIFYTSSRPTNHITARNEDEKHLGQNQTVPAYSLRQGVPGVYYPYQALFGVQMGAGLCQKVWR
jgi:hypothetical protein